MSVVHIDIHGQRYSLKSELEPQYVSELATLVDEKMRAAAQELTSADPLRIAVIAALNLADDLVRIREQGAGVEGRLIARTAEIERLVDAVLDDAQARVVNE
ncbi:MAG TPA: cell division protein ZapA [Vicinamibacterales bacterium]|nr:cell division protein ZapA [Vicinamibacterales bacterium]